MIGNEILSGKIEDTNAHLLVRELRGLGVRLREVRVIPDHAGTIAEAVRAASSRFDLVFTTGGVGPTHDDVTMKGVALGLGRPLERNGPFAEALRKAYGSRINDTLLGMADLPRGAELLDEEGLVVPVVRVGNVHILPGEPNFFRRKFLAIRERFRTAPFHIRRIFTLAEEGDIAAPMEETERRFAGVEVGSYPVYDNPEWKVQITIESKDPARLAEAFEWLRSRIPAGTIVRAE